MVRAGDVMSFPKFEGWPKIPRKAKQTFVVTEKVDGTNAQIYIVHDFTEDLLNDWKPHNNKLAVASKDGMSMFVGSRNRWITPEDDNYGFAKWVVENQDDLFSLGEGRHYGEWYGLGIQKHGYGLDEKRFALFNAGRWSDANISPKCCGCVPVIAVHQDGKVAIDMAMKLLHDKGSQIVPGFMEPEGCIAYDTASKQLWKTTFKCQNGKWAHTIEDK